VKIDSSDVNFLLLAEALRRAGRLGEANAVWAHAQKISPEFSKAQLSAGQMLSFAGLRPP